MTLPLKDASDLEWALGVGWTRFQRSCFGPMLQKALLYRYDHRGYVVAKKRWQEQYIHIQKTSSEPSYTPTDKDLTRFAETTRMLMLIDRESPTALAVITTYYGDRGARWGLERIGRIGSLMPLTDTGKKLVADSKLKYGTTFDIRDDEVIATDLDLQLRQPDSARGEIHAKMYSEAENLLMDANLLWKRIKRGRAIAGTG